MKSIHLLESDNRIQGEANPPVSCAKSSHERFAVGDSQTD